MSEQLMAIIIFFFLTNFIAFLVMMVDKIKSQRNGVRRISEGLMFFMATVLGSIGVYLGMFVFRHKTRKWYFVSGIPLLIIQNMAFLYVLYLLFFSSQGFDLTI